MKHNQEFSRINRKYSVVLETYLGIKKGELKITRDDLTISGYLTILNHCLPISGEITPDGGCFFTGSYITLLNKVNFKAKGSLTNEYVDLILQDPKNSFRLAGIART